MDRRKFLKDSSIITSAAAFGGLSACSGGDSTPPPPQPAASAPAAAAVPAEHPDLLASYWTIAGDVSPATGGREWSLFDFRDRVEAISRVGFKGMGLWHADVEHTLETYSLADMKRILDDNGIEHVELEFLMDWFLDGDLRTASDQMRAKFLTWAEALDARHIKVGDLVGRDAPPFDKIVEEFAALCQDAANVGSNVLFEMMPFAMLDNVEDPVRMCVEAGQANGGVMMDTWHMMKLGVPMEQIAGLPPEHLLGIELNDGWKETPEGLTLVQETVQQRQYPGEGEWDMPAFMAACQATGYDGPYGVEVINVENKSRSLDELCDIAYTTTASMFA